MGGPQTSAGERPEGICREGAGVPGSEAMRTRLNRLSTLLRSAARTAFAAALCSAASAADWPQWRGPHRNGSSDETGWCADWSRSPPRPLWEAEVGDGVSQPSVAGGRVYVVGLVEGAKDIVQCLDIDTGQPLWRATVPSVSAESESLGNSICGPVATPAVDGGRLFTYHRTHELRCWGVDGGEPLWTVDLLKQYGVCSSKRMIYWTPGNSPLALGDTVIVSGYGATGAVALHARTGRLVWRAAGADDRDYDGPRPQKGGSNVWTSPTAATVGGRLCILLNLNRDIVCLDAATGEEVWRHIESRWPGPACVGDVLAVGDELVAPGYMRGEGEGRVLDHRGRLVRRLPLLLTQTGSPALDRGWLLVPRLAVEVATGTAVRTANGEPIVVDGKILSLGPSTLTLGERGDGHYRLLGSVPVKADRWAGPVFSSGRILFRSSRTRLACWDLRAAPPDEAPAAGPGAGT
jgi:hypothetical protein